MGKSDWTYKDQLSAKAIQHTKEMEEKYSEEIKKSSENSVIFRGISENPSKEKSEKTKDAIIKHYCFLDEDSVSMIFSNKLNNILETKDKKIAVLNFASFKNPGGKFLEGSSAQEESLCHNSFLYNVLKRHMEDYYIPNQRNTHKCMYTDSAIYSKDIRFFKGDDSRIVDVITCAAPNRVGGERYHGVTMFQNLTALRNRIKFLKYICEQQKVEILIAGAFGCGVFGQDPYEVASAFLDVFNNQTEKITTVIHPVPYRLNRSNATVFNTLIERYNNFNFKL